MTVNTDQLKRQVLLHKQIPIINCLRGVAASMVCFFHFVTTTTGYVKSEDVKYLFSFGNTGVYMFFVISGVVIPLSLIKNGYNYNNLHNFMLKRLARLEPPYLFCIVLALVYFQVRKLVPTSAATDLTPELQDLLLHIGYLVPFFNARWVLEVFWTLGIEFQYYLIISLTLPLVTRIKTARFVFYGLFLVAPYILPHASFFHLYAPIFLIGIMYTLHITDLVGVWEYFIVTVLAGIASLFILPVSFTIVALLTIVIIYHLPNSKTPTLLFLGKISYSLYLLHTITGAAFINLMSHRFTHPYQKPIVIVLGFGLSVVCAYIFFKLIEQPSLRLSSRIKLKNKLYK
jgi:Predicted acyltransferases